MNLSAPVLRSGRRLSALGLAALVATAGAYAAGDAETVSPKLQQPIANLPGQTFTAAVVDFGPGVRAAPHTHGEAFVYAYVLKGSVRSQLDDQPAKVYRTGESWYEPPGAHHKVTENVSASEPAALLVVFVAPTGQPIKIPDNP